MKKIYLFIGLLFAFLIPNKVFADGTNTYYIEANIQTNGDMHIKEYKVLDGSYNGFETTLRYRNLNLREFSGILDDFEGSSIYNGSDLTDLKVYDAPIGNDFNLINKLGKEFQLVSSASKGDYGKYTKSINGEGVDLLIYMPSSYDKASLVTYVIKDAVVVHNDIAEIAWDFIGSNYKEDINNLKVVVNLPSDSNELRVFSHGPLNGNNRIINKRSVEMTYEYLYAYNAVDMRVVFDKSLVPNATKKSNIDGLNNILDVEQKRADRANQEREVAYKALENEAKSKVSIASSSLKKKDYDSAVSLVNSLKDGEVKESLIKELNTIKEKIDKRILTLTIIVYGIAFAWLAGLVYIIKYVYTKHDKEYESDFNGQYFRDFPAEYGPEVVSYLINRNISENSFSSCVLELIRKKILTVEEINIEVKKIIGKKDKKDYKIIKNKNIDLNTLTSSESKLLTLLIDTIGNGEFVTLEGVTDYSKNYKTAKNFMTGYTSWKDEAESLGIQENFFETSVGAKVKSVLYTFILIPIIILAVYFEINFLILLLFLIPMIGSIIYFASYTKKTKKGISHYKKWIGLKNFLLDFGRFQDKELPEIHLWERYLVYATMFGIADKVQEVMKIRLQDMNYDNTTFTFLYFNNWYFYHSLNTALNNTISSARSTITQHEIASSSSSSGSGFGGGSSFGGGGFGGGGSGGGRF